MADIYVRSTDGNNSDNGSTWALAKLDLAGAAAIDAAGDTIYVSQSHAESTAASITVALAGTGPSPTKVVCVNDGAEPPTAIAATATVTTTGTSSITFSGVNFYVEGLTFAAGTGTGAASIILSSNNNAWCKYKSCSFRLVATGSGAIVLSSSAAVATYEDCTFRFSAAGQGLRINNGGKVVINGGSLLSGGTSPTALFIAPTNTQTQDVLVSGFDLSNASAGVRIFTSSSRAVKGVIRNSKLPASWSGSLITGGMTNGERYELYNCDSGDTNYRMVIKDYAGDITQETTIVRSGGATDGTTPISWKLVSTANAEYPHITLDTPEIVRWQETTGSSITVTVETITDGVTLTDDECWIEVQYLGTSGFPLGTFINDAKASILATAANQTASSETWTTTGLTTPVKQKLSVTFTPQEKGYIHAVVKLAKASTTVYVDPELTVT